MKYLFIFILSFISFECVKPESDKTDSQKLLPLIFLGQGNGAVYQWNLPKGFVQPIVPIENPMSDAKVELGRFLFYDKKLSQNQTQSCSSCHIQALAFSDGKGRGEGSTGDIHPRSPQQLSNVAYHPRLNWANPNMKTLEEQSRGPMFGIEPIELGLVGNEYLERFKTEAKYLELFNQAFGRGIEKITEEKIRFALASFQRTLISGSSSFDKYNNGDKTAMSASAIRGLSIFNSETAECFHCHGGFNFTDSSLHTKTVFEEISYHDNGNRSLTEYATLKNDQKGLFQITEKTTDIGKFRSPSLRNIALTYPYMHDGSIDCSPENKGTIGVFHEACSTEALKKVIAHYMSGGKSPSNKDGTLIRPFSLTNQEVDDLVEFLKSLTDEEFIKNPKFSSPF
jgi:cytochrome c peroxidase